MFYQQVDTRSRKAMVTFLSAHFRYDTMSFWNNSTSYAHNMKLYNLPLSRVERDRCHALLSQDGAYDGVSQLINAFGSKHAWNYRAGFNGRSGGYLVLYEGCLRNGASYCVAGRSVDQEDDFSEWTMEGLRERVKLVQEFDKLADDIVEEARYMANSYGEEKAS